MIFSILAGKTAKELLVNKYTICMAIAAGIFFAGFLKGCQYEHNRNVARQETTATKQITEINESTEDQEEIEVAHDKRVYKILSGFVPADDAARMLSSWPDEAPDAP